MRVLLIGGAGYIGSHIAESLIVSGLRPVVLDNLSTGIRSRIGSESIFVEGDARNSHLVSQICLEYDINAIVHLAALKSARESVDRPYTYWRTNLDLLFGVLEGMRHSNVKKFILSSSCSIFGEYIQKEDVFSNSPQSPYARTKYSIELALEDISKELNFSFGILRYFNAVGCSNFHMACDIAQDSVLPSFFKSILEFNKVAIYGENLPTKDGTPVRDYIDVRDVAYAHVKALNSLDTFSTENLVWNVSTGIPRSVLEVADFVSKVHPRKFKIEFLDSRHGDPIEIWAKPSPSLISTGWLPRYVIEESIQSQYEVMKRDFFNFI